MPRAPIHAGLTHTILHGVAILLCATVCSPAFGGETDTTATEADRIGKTEAAAKQDYSKKLICKRESVTGSNVRKRVCRTQAQIDADKEASDRYMHDMNVHAGKAGPPQ